MKKITYSVELIDENGNGEIIEENIEYLDKAVDTALSFARYENNLSKSDKKKSCVVVSEIDDGIWNSIDTIAFEQKGGYIDVIYR